MKKDGTRLAARGGHSKSLVDQGQAPTAPQGSTNQGAAKGKKQIFAHGTEQVSQHHRGGGKY